MKNDIFWSEIGSGFGEPGGTPHQEFPEPDHLLPRVLKKCAIEIAPNFCSLLNRSFFAGEVPNTWKTVNTVSVLERTC